MNLVTSYRKLVNRLQLIESLPLLVIRIVLAYGFLGPAKMKLGNIHGIAQWFGSMGYPVPLLSAYLAATTETLGIILLTLGLGTRVISIPLMFVMLVAIFTVHISHGFQAANNGFEIPLYYLIMLFTLLVYGSGKYSIDYLISRKNR